MSRPNLHIGPKVKGKVGSNVDTKSKAVVTGCDSNANVQVGASIDSDVGGSLTTVEDAQITFSENSRTHSNLEGKTIIGSDVSIEPVLERVIPRTYTNVGAFNLVRNVTGNYSSKTTVNGKLSDVRNKQIGDVTRVGSLGGSVTCDSDVNLSGETDETSKKDNLRRKAEHVVPQIKGRVTIFNQEFKETKDFRLGSANDVERLKTTFAKFGAEVIDKPDLKLEHIVEEIKAISKDDFSSLKLFVCIFMSHGQANDVVKAADKKFLLKETIIDPIMQNKSLNGVAKIFIVVACRGDNRHGLDVSGNYREFDRVELDASVVRSEHAIDYSNCIFSYSTFEDYVSLRTADGTYFIQELCDNIDKANGDTTIHSIFAEVNDKLSKKGYQVPVFKTTMGNVCFKDLV